MTEKDKFINKKEQQLEKLKIELYKLAEKAKKKNKPKKLKCLSEIIKVRRKFRTARNRLQRLREADVVQWEKCRIKVRDSILDIRGAIDRLSIKIK